MQTRARTFSLRRDGCKEKAIELMSLRIKGKFIKDNKGVSYANIAAAFDIETTSFFHTCGNDVKQAVMYIWMFAVEEIVVLGRTWDDYFSFLDSLSTALELNSKKRLVVYVHNLSYEFQFMRKWQTWEKVFSLDERKPVYALNTIGIEYRCSYILSGYGLAKLSDQLLKHNVKKRVGDLNYSKKRNSLTRMTRKEIGYCLLDVIVVNCYITETIEKNGGIINIPLTKTGYVRRYCKRECLFDTTGKKKYQSVKYKKYSALMRSLVMDADEYRQLKRAFAGGFTHASPLYSQMELRDVGSDDFTSSYPAVMVSEEFPMSTGERVTITSKEELQDNLKNFCCLFDLELFDVESRVQFESYISSSKCFELESPVLNNGRIYSAKRLKMTVTELDYKIIRYFYKCSKMLITNFIRYRKNYLPTALVKSILKLYEQKTTLKGVKGKEVEYLRSKEDLNSCYGMMVTDIVRPEILYSGDEWSEDKPELEEAIRKYNNSKSRFLFYPWGVWVTAYARYNLFQGIVEFGKDGDYVYSDTDSIKSRNRERHTQFLDEYNRNIKKKLLKALEYHGLPASMIEPVTVKGERKLLGVWDFEGTYSRFKTLGAKRYMTEKNGEISITVSGLNKEIAVPYILKQAGGGNPFDLFSDDLYIPDYATGKNTHTYIDDEQRGLLTDYNGVTAEYKELSSVHLMGSDYSLSITDSYMKFILGIKEGVL